MTIIAFSDVHLGYDKSDSTSFMRFLERLESRSDLEDIVIIGDFIDLWRRDIIGLEFELSPFMERLKKLRERCNVHYVIGNHDFHLRNLRKRGYPFRFTSSLVLRKAGYKFFFLHGFQCDPIQMALYPTLLELMCWTLSDDLGKKKSDIWDRIHPLKPKLEKQELYEIVDELYEPPSSSQRKKTLGLTEEIVQCIRKKFRLVKKNEFVVYGHTHEPSLYPDDRIANTGSWVKSDKTHNTYFEFSEWPPKVSVFGGPEIKCGKLDFQKVA